MAYAYQPPDIPALIQQGMNLTPNNLNAQAQPALTQANTNLLNQQGTEVQLKNQKTQMSMPVLQNYVDSMLAQQQMQQISQSQQLQQSSPGPLSIGEDPQGTVQQDAVDPASTPDAKAQRMASHADQIGDWVAKNFQAPPQALNAQQSQQYQTMGGLEGFGQLQPGAAEAYKTGILQNQTFIAQQNEIKARQAFKHVEDIEASDEPLAMLKTIDKNEYDILKSINPHLDDAAVKAYFKKIGPQLYPYTNRGIKLNTDGYVVSVDNEKPIVGMEGRVNGMSQDDQVALLGSLTHLDDVKDKFGNVTPTAHWQTLINPATGRRYNDVSDAYRTIGNATAQKPGVGAGIGSTPTSQNAGPPNPAPARVVPQDKNPVGAKDHDPTGDATPSTTLDPVVVFNSKLPNKGGPTQASQKLPANARLAAPGAYGGEPQQGGDWSSAPAFDYKGADDEPTQFNAKDNLDDYRVRKTQAIADAKKNFDVAQTNIGNYQQVMANVASGVTNTGPLFPLANQLQSVVQQVIGKNPNASWADVLSQHPELGQELGKFLGDMSITNVGGDLRNAGAGTLRASAAMMGITMNKLSPSPEMLKGAVQDLLKWRMANSLADKQKYGPEWQTYVQNGKNTDDFDRENQARVDRNAQVQYYYNQMGSDGRPKNLPKTASFPNPNNYPAVDKKGWELKYDKTNNSWGYVNPQAQSYMAPGDRYYNATTGRP